MPIAIAIVKTILSLSLTKEHLMVSTADKNVGRRRISDISKIFVTN
jgi:hypothetical protein